MRAKVIVRSLSVTGPIDIVQNNITGCLNDDLKQAALDALELDPSQCLAQASEYTWERATKMFQSNLTAAHAN